MLMHKGNGISIRVNRHQVTLKTYLSCKLSFLGATFDF